MFKIIGGFLIVEGFISMCDPVNDLRLIPQMSRAIRIGIGGFLWALPN